MSNAKPTPPWLTKLVEGITYKPGWTFRAVNDHEGGCAIVARTTVTCATHGTPYESELWCYVWEWSTQEDSWARKLLGQILRFEEHEAKEHFKLHGKLVQDPHAEHVLLACACGAPLT